MKKKQYSLDTSDVRGLVWRLAIPSMLAQFVSVLYSIVDRMYIGNIPNTGEVALAGVGICGPIVNLIASFAFLVGVGGAPLMSIRMGSKDEQGAERILANCFLMLVVTAVCLTIGVFFFKNTLLFWFGASEQTFFYANEYFSWYLMGTVFALLSVGMNQFIICQGYAKLGMATVMVGAAMNILLDPVFIFGLKMGVRGAALATVFSQICSTIFVLCVLLGNKIPIRLTFRGYSSSVMKQVIGIGITPFLIVAFDNILIIALNSVISEYGGGAQGDKLLTCMTIVQSFMLLVTMPMSGITSGTQTILGFNYGAKRPDYVMRAMRWIGVLCVVFTSLMFVFARVASGAFVRIFTRDPEYITLTVWAIRQYTLAIIPLGVQYTIVDGLTGMGITRLSMPFSAFRKAVFLTAVFLIPRMYGVSNIFYAEPISDLFGTALTVAVFILVGRDMIYGKKQKLLGRRNS